MTVEEALAYLKADAASNGTISLRAPMAREAVAVIEAEIDRLKDRLALKWAYDGSGARVPFPEGMEDCDGIACRDETIRGLEERLAANQSRTFEDGARWTFTGKSLLSFGGGSTHEWFRRSDGLLRHFPDGFDPNTGAYGGAHVSIRLVDALPLQPEGERSDA